MKKYIVPSLVVALAIVLVFLWNSDIFLTPYQKFYAGDVRNFRGNLNEAAKVPVYPNESSIVNVLMGPDVYRISIAFFPNDNENSFYLADSFEITNKLSIIYRSYLGTNVTTYKDSDGSACLIFYPDKHVRCFKSVPINSTDELIPTSIEPVILLRGPSTANQTAVTVDNYLITAEGESFDETDRDYTDLDLAVDKLILVLMNI
ncbi:MAG: hypothetical protein JW700_04285 [Candidatus Aenigmarchaeota archaeon]|nr:hypothetical protein [Candidatus Aenigmarchaeota archaeon]